MKQTNENGTKNARWEKINLIEVFIIIAVVGIIGKVTYNLLHWNETVTEFKRLGLWGSILAIGFVFGIRRIIDKL